MAIIIETHTQYSYYKIGIIQKRRELKNKNKIV